MRRPVRKQRKRIFIGCEGDSERGYIARIHQLLELSHQEFHLDPVILGGGDPLSMLMVAKIQLRRRENPSTPYAHRFIFVDSDRLQNAASRKAQTLTLAQELGITLVWQVPCHEGFLLRHLPNCKMKNPSSTKDAEAYLKRRWPNYQKPMNAAELTPYIDRAAVVRAASVEAALLDFLKKIRFF